MDQFWDFSPQSEDGTNLHRSRTNQTVPVSHHTETSLQARPGGSEDVFPLKVFQEICEEMNRLKIEKMKLQDMVVKLMQNVGLPVESWSSDGPLPVNSRQGSGSMDRYYEFSHRRGDGTKDHNRNMEPTRSPPDDSSEEYIKNLLQQQEKLRLDLATLRYKNAEKDKEIQELKKNMAELKHSGGPVKPWSSYSPVVVNSEQQSRSMDQFWDISPQSEDGTKDHNNRNSVRHQVSRTNQTVPVSHHTEVCS
ncbi:unnamed protein product [Ophioblennius macclurei]